MALGERLANVLAVEAGERVANRGAISALRRYEKMVSNPTQRTHWHVKGSSMSCRKMLPYRGPQLLFKAS